MAKLIMRDRRHRLIKKGDPRIYVLQQEQLFSVFKNKANVQWKVICFTSIMSVVLPCTLRQISSNFIM